MKKLIALLTAVLCLLAVFSGCKKEEPSPYLKGKHHVEIEVKDYGTIALELDADTAPISVTNFIELAKSGFYDGLTFHRVIKGFMIQGGDPFTRDSTKVAQFGTGGPGYTIPAEIVPGLTHKKGALAAARRGDMVNPAKESSGSQFYIVHDPDNCVHLDGEYTIFGEVVEGLDVIDKLASERTDFRDRPVKDVQIISITPAN